MRFRNYFFLLLFILGYQSHVSSQDFKWKFLGDSSIKSSIRGSMVERKSGIAWLSGSNGTLGRKRPEDSGFVFYRINRFETYDFRDVFAFDSSNILLMSSGTPAVIIRSSDGGKNWKQVYFSNDSAIFLDGIDFWKNGHGLCLGDPVKGFFFILETVDSGKSWNERPGPPADSSEAAFAASGTAIKCLDEGKVILVSGGKHSHLFIGTQYGMSWQIVPLDKMIQGKESQGCYSFDAVLNRNKFFILGVGGDYKEPGRFQWEEYHPKKFNAFYIKAKWKGNSTLSFVTKIRTFYPKLMPSGYCSAVVSLSLNKWVACGSQGVYFSSDQGKHWKIITQKGFNTIALINENELVFSGSGKNTFLLKISDTF